MKRSFDFCFAALAILLALPVILVVALVIKINLGGPVMFYQIRPGQNAKPFKIYKFRTMLLLKNNSGELLPDIQRMTRTGNILRNLSLDELPQLINVLKGDLSIVGPRPLLMEYLPLYNTEQARRHKVKPGVTGWAQVNGRNAISWDEKFKLDIWYVNHQSFYLDMKIIILTIKKVLFRSDISASDEVTMPKFTGTSNQ